MQDAPVITSLNHEQLELFASYIQELRGDNARMAEEEAEKLEPYFRALATKLAADQRATGEEDREIIDLATPGNLCKLFNKFARRTDNTILSDIAIVPQSLLSRPEATTNTTQFSAESYYNGHSFNFGFIQAFQDDKNGSTAIPVLAFDSALMASLDPFQPLAMLKALQTIATTSNHDMQHHLTSTILNTDIARTARGNGLPDPAYTVRDWSRQYFKGATSDADPRSYEAFLMFNHAQVRHLMENGAEWNALKEACDVFFRELKRVGKEMAAAVSLEKAHEAVDYFGMMMIFSLARSMPLDHPLIEHVIKGLQDADPDPDAVCKEQEAILMKTAFPWPLNKRPISLEALSSYRAHGMELLPEGLTIPATHLDKEQNQKFKQDMEALPPQSYALLKKLQLINIEPWVLNLMSPGRPDTVLGRMQARAGQVNIDMLRSSALTAWFSAVDGPHTAKRADGAVLETYFRDGELHREDGPALVEIAADGVIVKEQWYRDGRLYREGGEPDLIDASLGRTEEWHDQNGRLRHSIHGYPGGRTSVENWLDENGMLHNENGPAYQVKNADGRIFEEAWRQHGKFHREGAAADIIDNGITHKEGWYKDGEQHRIGGPSLLVKDRDGEVIEETWKQNGILNRDDGPAHSWTADGTYAEYWWKDGEQHRDGGPAATKISDHGKVKKEEWYQHDKLHNDNGPAVVETDQFGTVVEIWCQNGKRHRDDGPAFIAAYADGRRVELWWKDGKQVTPPATQPAVKAAKPVANTSKTSPPPHT